MNTKIENEVYVKHFGKNLKIENDFIPGNEESRYVYHISYKENTYILKGFRIPIEQFNPEDERSADFFVKSLEQISEILQEYHFARAASLISPHIASPLYLDLMVDMAKDKTSFSYMHIQIIFEYGGVALSKLQPTTIKQTYNLMRQSANALLLLHNLEIAHLDIKPDNMVYDTKKDLLKIVDMGSAFGGSNRRRVGATTKELEKKVTSTTQEFAPPEVLFMEKGSTKQLELKFYLTAIDVYCWAMSFFAILNNKSSMDLKNYSTRYRTGLEPSYKEFIKIVETTFDSIKSKNSKDTELITVVSNLLTKALQYKPKERPIMKDIIHEMKKFEKEKKYILHYSKAELEHSKKLLELLVYNDPTRIQSPILDEIAYLSCGHEVAKDYLVKYTLKLFIQRNPYDHNYFCETCRKAQKLKSFPLSCGCVWTKFGKKIEHNNDLTKDSYGKCDKGHPLTSIDVGLVNDFVSLKFTSLMITDYPQEKEELVDSFNSSVRGENLKDIAWILRHSKAVTKLHLYCNNIEDEDAKGIGGALKINTTVIELNLSNNKIGIEGSKVIAEALRTNSVLTKLNLSGNNIGVDGSKVIAEALKTNTTLTELNLSGNNIGVEGGKVITEALKTNTTLTTLSISNNNIKDEYMKTISELLKSNTTLKELDLCSNEITDKGVRIICEALKVNTTLKELHLEYNKLGVKGEELLKEVKEKHKHIEIMY